MKILRPEELIASGKFPELKELTPEELKEAYALSRAYFTEEDLARFADLDEGTPMEDVLKDLDEVQHQFDARSS
jgi:hypothetical protein